MTEERSAWSPLKNSLFRSLWIATIVSNIGTWMQRAAQDWLVLTQLTHHSASAVGIVMALSNIEDHPGQAIGSLIGQMYFGPLGSMVGGMIGGMLDEAGVFGKPDAPPPPQGIVSFEWDEAGHIHTQTQTNIQGGASAAAQVAASVLANLQSAIDSANAQTLQNVVTYDTVIDVENSERLRTPAISSTRMSSCAPMMKPSQPSPMHTITNSQKNCLKIGR